MSIAEEVWERTGIGVTADGWPRTSAQDRTVTDGSGAKEVWHRMGIGVTMDEQPSGAASVRIRTLTDGRPRTSARDRTLTDMSSAEEVWERMGIGVTPDKLPSTTASARKRTQADGRLRTSAQDRPHVDERLQISLEGTAMDPETPGSDGKFQAVQMDTQISDEAMHDCFLNSQVYHVNRSQLSEQCRKDAEQLA